MPKDKNFGLQINATEVCTGWLHIQYILYTNAKLFEDPICAIFSENRDLNMNMTCHIKIGESSGGPTKWPRE